MMKRCTKEHPQQQGIWHKRLRSTCQEQEEERLPMKRCRKQHPQQQGIWHKRLRSTCREQEEEERLPMKRCRKQHLQQQGIWHKRLRSTCREEEEEERLPTDQFERLPDELVTAILMRHASSASCPADLHTPMLVCKRFYNAASHPMVLAQASKGALSVKASKWCDPIHGFLKRCADSGNMEACYILGMISFYCLRDREGGARLMEKAAKAAHVEALYSLAVMKLNGSGRPNVDDKDVRAGVALCMQAVAQQHIPAMRELGQCFEDGYGVPANAGDSRRLFLHANAREAMLAGLLPPSNTNTNSSYSADKLEETGPAIEMAMQRALPIPETHPVHEFLVEWFEEHPLWDDHDDDLRMCHYNKCGRPETRPSEFRYFDDMHLGTAPYCSRSCHTLRWRSLSRFLRWGL